MLFQQDIAGCIEIICISVVQTCYRFELNTRIQDIAAEISVKTLNVADRDQLIRITVGNHQLRLRIPAGQNRFVLRKCLIKSLNQAALRIELAIFVKH